MAATAKTPDALIDELAKQGMVQDALRLRAHLLPKRQAVWWGCLCVREDVESPLPAPQVAALKAAEDWVREPDEDHRRVAEKRSEEAKYSGVGATLALSAFWSEGSIAPEGNQDVVADERLTSQGVAAALISAAYHGDPSKALSEPRPFLPKVGIWRAGRFHCRKATADSGYQTSRLRKDLVPRAIGTGLRTARVAAENVAGPPIITVGQPAAIVPP